MDIIGTPLAALLRLRSSLPRLKLLSCFSRWLILSCTRRLSTSSFVSPWPLPPIPPASLERAVPLPVSLEKRYFNCASSTCTFPSLLCAVKISFFQAHRQRDCPFK